MTAAPPLRRSWLVVELQRRTVSMVFLDIFQAVAPREAERVRGESPFRIYAALCDWLGARVPLFEPELDDDGQWYEDDELDDDPEPGPYDEVERALEYGIPVNFQGFDESDLNPAFPAVALAYWLSPDEYRGSEREILPHALTKYGKALSGLASGSAHREHTVPPDGRRWKGAWAGLPDLYAYVTHSTGCGLLDYTQTMVYEAGDLPPWDVDEVKGLLADWQRGKPMWERIKGQVNHVGRDPARLRELGLALSGDEAARMKLSEPMRGKTLAQIFTKEQKRGRR